MKIFSLAYLCMLGGLVSIQAQSPAFNCGSNGSYGAMNITSTTTLQMPPDGVFHCTTITVGNGATLSFAKNPLNSPVYLLATGDVLISGAIEVNGQAGRGGPGNPGLGGGNGGPGGFAGGDGSSTDSIPAGTGGGPGGGSRGIGNGQNAGNAGGGSFRTVAYTSQGADPTPPAAGGSVYGNSLLIPLVGGSGGGGFHWTGGGAGGGGGGGAILIASNTAIRFGVSGNPGYIRANGGSHAFVYRSYPQTSQSGGGSGGAIRLVAPLVSGKLEASFSGSSPGWGGDGRFRVDSFDMSALLFSNAPPTSTGSVMIVFPNPMPKLSVSNAAGTAVVENASGPVSVILPAGSNPSQTIQVRARDFGSVVPIRVRLVPESGDAVTYDAIIDNTVNNPATTSVPVTLPVNTGVRVEVFTR